MTVEVKICGIRSAEALDAALEAGAEYFGLVFYPPSPRSLDAASGRALVARATGRARAIALLVDPSDEELSRIVGEVRPDFLQLHGSETPQRVAAVRALAGCPVIKAVKVANVHDAAAGAAYSSADLILYDAAVPADRPQALPGGNGVPFDWRALAGVSRDTGFILSGGLNSDNVGAAIAATGAPIVDVSSGVERAPGDKDPDLICRFVAAAKAAAPAG